MCWLGAYEVEADNVIVALSGVELDGEASRVACFVWELSTQGDGREPHKSWGLFADRR
jgi:hypothetical protein